jgi:hypothetical protein
MPLLYLKRALRNTTRLPASVSARTSDEDDTRAEQPNLYRAESGDLGDDLFALRMAAYIALTNRPKLKIGLGEGGQANGITLHS